MTNKDLTAYGMSGATENSAGLVKQSPETPTIKTGEILIYSRLPVLNGKNIPVQVIVRIKMSILNNSAYYKVRWKLLNNGNNSKEACFKTGSHK
ncbi:MAG TPA: hypothetical protein VK483_00625 [Chitinophagaceae bacterium]|nr:hypothetical protein [Chitinophagaceae bacterium]